MYTCTFELIYLVLCFIKAKLQEKCLANIFVSLIIFIIIINHGCNSLLV